MIATEGPPSAPPPVARRGHVRAVVLIAIAVVTLVASGWHVLAPAPTPRAAVSTSSPTGIAPQNILVKRPYGEAHMDGLDFPSPEMQAPERTFIHQVIASGLVVQRVDPDPWDNRFSHADSDIITTNRGDLSVIAPYDPAHPVWVCQRGVVILGGTDVPTYELAAGGSTITVQIAGPVSFGRAGDVLVWTQDQGMWQRLSNVLSPATCPEGT